VLFLQQEKQLLLLLLLPRQLLTAHCRLQRWVCCVAAAHHLRNVTENTGQELPTHGLPLVLLVLLLRHWMSDARWLVVGVVEVVLAAWIACLRKTTQLLDVLLLLPAMAATALLLVPLLQ
jgi:hypothetical protein